MQKERLPYKRIAAGIRAKKIAVGAAFCVACALSLVFLGDFHYYNGIERVGVGLGLHPLIVLAVIALEAVAAVILFSRAEKSADAIFDRDCEPLLNFQVRKELMPLRDHETSLPLIELSTSYYIGDFAKCEKIADTVAGFSGAHDRLHGLSYRGLAAYFLGDRAALEVSRRDFDRLLERSGLKLRSPLRRDMDRRQKLLAMLALLMQDDASAALSFADSLYIAEGDVPPIDRLNILYLRALTYEACGEKKKARDCFEECRAIPNKTFISEKLNERP